MNPDSAAEKIIPFEDPLSAQQRNENKESPPQENEQQAPQKREQPERHQKVRIIAQQLNLFTGEPEPVVVEVEEPKQEDIEYEVDKGITLVKSENASQIVLSGFGINLGKKSERLLVKKEGKVIYQFPFFRLNEVVIASRGISISSDLIEELCAQGIRIAFLSGGGKPYAMITSPMLSATVSSKREQILAYNDERGAKLSKIIIEGKIKNQEALLKYFGKYIKKVDLPRHEQIAEKADALAALRKQVGGAKGSSINEIRATLMGHEGAAGRIYWEGVSLIINQKAEFFGRVRRGAVDEVNSMLNYGYGILYSQVWGAVLNAGLEPFAGFLHVDRPGKPSLVLDLVEEFRQPVVDRTVLSHINLGESITMEGGLLDQDTRRHIGNRIIERLESHESYEGKKYQIRSIIQKQARSVCRFLRGEGDYRTFSFKW